MSKTPAWQRKEGKSESGGLNEKGRASLKAEGHDIKRPQPEGGPRKDSFCARMKGMKKKLTSAETANDPDSRINKSLRAWNCADGGAVDPYDSVQQAAKGGKIWDKPRPKKLGKPEPLSSKEKANAKAAAKASGRPYPNLIDNMRAARADGGPADDRAHEFVQEQLRSGEPQVPQYVAENDFPARAARGVEAVDTAASRVNNMLANVAGQPAMRSPEGRSASEIVQSAMPVDPYHAVQQAAGQWREGDKLGAAETMAAGMPMQGAIRSYHGSPYQFERFDTGKIGTGVGAQAYGHGLYFSDNPSVARGYRHSTEPVTISGRPVYSLYQDIENRAANVPIQNASSYYDKLSVLEHLMDKGDALAVRDAAERHMFSPESYEWFRKSIEPNLRTPGGLYEVGINAAPKKFIGLYDELSLSDPLRERVASLAERATRLDEGNPLFRKGQEAMKAVRRQNATGAQMTDALDELLGYQKNPLRELVGISPELKAPEAVSKYLQNEGYAGYTYPHGMDAPGPETLNRVVFDPKRVDILRRYADGGQVEGDVQFADDDPYAKVQEAAKLPMMAQNDFAMRMPEPEVRYDTGPQPGEATLKGYDPTIKERIYQGIAGTEERPSPERAQFARGMSQMAEFAPVLGNVMAGQEAQRRGDTKGMLMAALPVPGMATEARMAEAAISPAEQAAREAYQRVLNAQGLYSHAAEAAYNLPQAKGSYEQMMAMLKSAGVKPEEMRWSGVEQFAGQPVTREQLASHFEQNLPKIEETVLGSPDETKMNEADAAVREAIRAYNEGQVAPRYYAHNPERSYASSFFPTREEAEAHIPTLPASYHAGTTVEEFPAKPIDVYETMRRLHNGEFVYNLPPGVNRAALNLIDERNALAEAAEQSGTKFGQYTLPGGQNYRELLLHTPGAKPEKEFVVTGSFPMTFASRAEAQDYIRKLEKMREEMPEIAPALDRHPINILEQDSPRTMRSDKEFHSSHWDQPNVLGHLRMSDRTGPEGEKILHLEELQSDWGQQGRDKGFKNQKATENATNAYNIWEKSRKETTDIANRLIEEKTFSGDHPEYIAATQREETARIAANEAAQAAKNESQALPSAPYVESTKNWTDLGLKRALKEAAEGGYSKMVWTPGEEQAARYDLSKQISEIKYNAPGSWREKKFGPVLKAFDKNGDQVINKAVKPDELSNYIGKEAAEKLLNADTVDGHHVLSGMDLSVGGEGMQGFYDKIVPTRLKELLKKIDPQAKIETDYIKTGDEWPFSARIASDGESYWLAGNSPYAEGEQRLSGKFSSYADADKQRERLYAGYHKPVHSITITPKMREAILKGLPAYAKGGEVVNKVDPYDNIRLKAKNFPRARRASH